MNSLSRHAVALVCLISGAVVHGSAFAQTGASLADLVRETQKQSDVRGELTMIWWLPEEQLSADVSNLLALMRSMFANMLGPMGEGMSSSSRARPRTGL